MAFANAAKIGELVTCHLRKGKKLSDAGLHFIHARIFRRSAVHGSFVPYILALHLVLARPSDPAAITGLCD